MTGNLASRCFLCSYSRNEGSIGLQLTVYLQLGSHLQGHTGCLSHLVHYLMFGTSLGREAQHSHTRLSEASHTLGRLCRADCYLCQLTGIWHWCNGHIAYHEHTVFAIVLLLRYEKHGSADARNAWGTLDNLQCRTQCLARCRERTADLSVGIACLYDHAAKVERVLHKLAGLLDGHSFPLAQLSKQLCILLALGIVVGIDDCSLVKMGQSPLFSQAGNLFRIAYKDDVGHLVGQNPVGSPQCTLLGSFGEHDALLSSFSACYDLL